MIPYYFLDKGYSKLNPIISHDTVIFSRQTIFYTKSYTHDTRLFSRQTILHTKSYMYLHGTILFLYERYSTLNIT